MAAMADPAHLEFRRRHHDLLGGSGAAEIDPERPVDDQHVEAEKAEYRPGAHQQKAMPATKLTAPINTISTKKPVRLSERCGVSHAENSVGWSSCDQSLPAVIAYQYIPIMAKITRTSAPKNPAFHRCRRPAKKAPEAIKSPQAAGEEVKPSL